jgi:class 3 adenylate cyclase/tetratricopeptide (TPR) repeat protein
VTAAATSRAAVESALVLHGVSAELAAPLADAVLAVPPGSFERSELDGASPARLAVLAAIVAAFDVRRFGVALRALLASLELLERAGAPDEGLDALDALDVMDAFDRGRAWHLRGFVALRLDREKARADRALRKSVRALLEDGSKAASAYLARVHDTRGQLLHSQGELGEARRELELAARLRRENGDELGLAITLGNLGRLCFELGDFDAAERLLRDDLELVERLSPDRTQLRAQLCSHLARCALERGQVPEARALLDRSEALAGDDAIAAGFVLVGRGTLALRGGDASLARVLAEQAHARLDASPLPSPLIAGLHAEIERLAGDAALAEGDAAPASARYGQAAEVLAAQVGSPLDRARVLDGLSRAHAALGEHQIAATELRAAVRALDGTAAHALREELETELRTKYRDSWLLHAAGRFVGQEHIEFLLSEAGHAGFRGARRRVATLFSDVRGFTAISEQLEPEQLIAWLNELLGGLTRCIDASGGMVDKFIGDAVMALFPSPARPEAIVDADAVVEAALAMTDEIARFNEAHAMRKTLRLGIGIHAGDVVCGLIGSPQKREFTAMGDVVNTASRLEGMTKQLGADILISDAIESALAERDRFLLRPLGRFRPKGRATPIAVWDVMGERDGTRAARAIDVEIAEAEAALTALASMDFASAEARFAALAARHGTTTRAPGYELHRAHAAAMRAPPPGAGWDGAVVLTEK